MSAASRTALLAGASGLVGREILAGLLADAGVGAVHALARRPLPSSHPRLTQHVVDFAALAALPPVDEAYLALGTTIKVAGSQAAFRAVDFDANLAVARAARAAGARRLGLVSAMGASARSSVFYSRVKGELEAAVRQLGYEGIVIARPSVLAGDRESLGQPARSGEKLALRVSTWLRPLVPADYRAIPARDVAATLLREVPRAAGVRVILSGAMHGGAASDGR
ncbi:MAG TPA: nucleoside-diphosphate sugar epimerase [Ramlibacter sp.]|nr:nucleoside-diphosphate sugar epimerase [Ramlibacter sp.]